MSEPQHYCQVKRSEGRKEGESFLLGYIELSSARFDALYEWEYLDFREKVFAYSKGNVEHVGYWHFLSAQF